MRQHNGSILVTEAALIKQFALNSSTNLLPSVPTGDIGNQILQITLRSTDEPWEFRFGPTGDYFYMAGLDIIVLPIRDRKVLEVFEFRAISAPADMRIIYEC